MDREQREAHHTLAEFLQMLGFNVSVNSLGIIVGRNPEFELVPITQVDEFYRMGR